MMQESKYLEKQSIFLYLIILVLSSIQLYHGYIYLTDLIDLYTDEILREKFKKYL